MATKSEGKKSDKSKKMDKSPASDPHREYLDMDSDEEEFGKPETPEPEEQLPPEPERPIFTEQQLNKLVRYVEDFSLLPGFEGVEWKVDRREIVLDYFRDPSLSIVTIYGSSEGNTKTIEARLEFPDHPVESLVYILRSPWQVYTPDNFHDTVKFGAITGRVENVALKILDNLYAPAVFRADAWPSVARNAIYSNMHHLLERLVEVAYSSTGLSMLYVPRENPDDSRIFVEDETRADGEPMDRVERDGEPLSRLETVANSWIRRTRRVLAEPTRSARNFSSIDDEFSFWNHRHDDLRSLQLQLGHRDVARLVERLESVQPTSVKQFRDLVEEVRLAIERARSNVAYLNLLVEPCSNLEAPEIVDENIKTILHLITFVREESPRYNETPRIEGLCRSLSNQIVVECRRFINLDDVFRGDQLAAKNSLEDCIRCCKRYETLYDEHVLVVSSMNLKKEGWTVRRDLALNGIRAFVDRCRDLIGICEAVEVFGRSAVPSRFGGANGAKYERYCENLESVFYAELEIVNELRGEIFEDSEASCWIRDAASFRERLAEIELSIGNLINVIFNEITHLDEGIEALFALRRYRPRRSLNDLLHLKWIDLWKMLDAEIAKVRSTILEEGENYHPSTPRFVGRASLLRLRKDRLNRCRTIMIEASDWLGDCEAQTLILRNCKKLSSAIGIEESSLFEAWERTIPDETTFARYFNEPILKRNASSSKSITVNANEAILESLREAKTWITLGYEVRPFLKKFTNKWIILTSRRDAVVRLCQLYNVIADRLLGEELPLFDKFADHVDGVVAPGLEKLTWNCVGVEKFYAESISELSNLRDFVRYFDKVESNIRKLCETIEQLAINFENLKQFAPFNVEEFVARVEDLRNEMLRGVVSRHEEMDGYIGVIREAFEADLDEISERWQLFANREDERFCKALRRALRSCLANASTFMETERDADTRFVGIQLDYRDIEITLREKIRTFGEVFAKLFPDILEALKSRRSFSKQTNISSESSEFLTSIATDETCTRLEKKITEGVKRIVARTDDTLRSFDCFEEISKVDVSAIGQSYAVEQQTLDSLELEISRCTRLVGSVEALPDEIIVSAILLDLRRAKTNAIDHCESWRDLLCVELSKIIVTERTFSNVSPPTSDDEDSTKSSCDSLSY